MGKITQEEALKYITKTKEGYIKDLEEIIGEETTRRFQSVGFIYGKNYWKVTKSGKQFYRTYKLSFFDILSSSLFPLGTIIYSTLAIILCVMTIIFMITKF
jgi:hypothetical protein